jgi:uncharacterized membrane protein YoaK (UPF0700 family)
MADPTDEPSRALALAVVLAAVAGFVDAHVYLFVVQVFVANQSGNLIGLGMATGQEDWHTASSTLVAIGAFVVGVVGATTLLRRDQRAGRAARPHVLLAVEAAALLVLGFGLWIADPRLSDGWRLVDLIVIVVAGTAMGVQSTSIRSVGRISVTTTYGTGALVRIGEKVAAPLRTGHGDADPLRIRTIGVVVVVLCGYVGGAAVSAALGSASWLVLVPAVAMVGATAAARPRIARP